MMIKMAFNLGVKHTLTFKQQSRKCAAKVKLKRKETQLSELTSCSSCCSLLGNAIDFSSLSGMGT